MKHLCAFYGAVAADVLSAIPVVKDDVLTQPGTDRFLVPADLNTLAWAAVLGTSVDRGQVVSPSILRKRMNLDVVPLVRGALVFALTGAGIFVPKADIVLDPTENIQLQASQNLGTSENDYGLLCLKSLGTPPAMPTGDIRVVRGTGTATLTANAWSSVTLTLDQDLEAGTYHLVGLVAFAIHAIAARVLFTGQGYRPGVPAISGASIGVALTHNAAFLDKYMWEDLGSFVHENLPAIQFLSSAADTAETVYLYLIKTA